MLINLTTLAYARARHQELEREADHERLLRAARRPAWSPRAGGIAALLLRAVRSAQPSRAARCAPSCAAV